MNSRRKRTISAIVIMAVFSIVIAAVFIHQNSKNNTPSDGNITESVSTEEPVSTKESVSTEEPVSTEKPVSTKGPVSSNEIDNNPILNIAASIVDTSVHESYSSLLNTSEQLKSAFPELITLGNIGYSAAGRKLLLIKMGNGSKKALVLGGMHAREHITTKFLLRSVETYCNTYYSESGLLGKYDIYALLNEYTFYIVPSINPDGLEIVTGNDSHAPGVYVSELSEYKANYNGVDLNRNFPIAWNEIDNGVTVPSDYYFKGYSAGSEPETKAVMDFCEKNHFEFALSVHVKGNCIYWGDTYGNEDGSLDDDNARYKKFAEKIAGQTGLYVNEIVDDGNLYGGGFENWFCHEYSRPGLCVELVTVDNTIKPCGDENYRNYSDFVREDSTQYLLAAAAK